MQAAEALKPDPPGGFATRWTRRLFTATEAVLALMLALMLVLVLGNVILRYGFSTGIDVSEELSRLLFIWVVFVGAVLAAREKAHIKVDLLSSKLSRRGRWLMAIAAECFVVACCVLVVWGTAAQHDISATTRSLVMGFSMSLVYGSAYVCCGGIGMVSLVRIGRLLREGPASAELDDGQAGVEIAAEAGV